MWLSTQYLYGKLYDIVSQTFSETSKEIECSVNDLQPVNVHPEKDDDVEKEDSISKSDPTKAVAAMNGTLESTPNSQETGNNPAVRDFNYNFTDIPDSGDNVCKVSKVRIYIITCIQVLLCVYSLLFGKNFMFTNAFNIDAVIFIIDTIIILMSLIVLISL